MSRPNKLNVLLIGSGGREHAIAWKLSQSPLLKNLITMPGNPGTAQYGTNISGDILSSSDVLQATKAHKIDLVVIGPEAPLEVGLTDELQSEGVLVFGPTAAAARLETSKAFAKAFMKRHNIPTAGFNLFDDIDSASDHIKSIPYEFVIKVSGLAAGKGVFLPKTISEAASILDDIFIKNVFGEAGREIVIEERLKGIEVSLLAFTDKKDFLLMPPAQDHKRLLDNDQGPNTGGMGVIAPSPHFTQELSQIAEDTIIRPTISGMEKEDTPYLGILYSGLMLTSEGPKVLEYNCRFGDPETQVILPLLDGDLLELLIACTNQSLSTYKHQVQWKGESAVCVVAASQGYPGKYPKGRLISGLDDLQVDELVFHAGTKLGENSIVTNGGRVLGITAVKPTLEEAVEHAYCALEKINFEGMHFRSDIGKTITAYQAAGVSIESGQQVSSLIKPAVAATYSPKVLSEVGSFGGLFDAGSFQGMDHPVLVSSMDGVGTKVILAAQSGNLESIGQDIVNHCVNDILVQGARPLFFMDYYASSKLLPEQVAEIISGISKACKAADCALLGGETAEMPGVYHENHFDLVGTIIGVVERENILPKKSISPGDVLIGLSSSGPHTNGYTLIRKIFKDIPLDQIDPELGQSLGEALLAPHRSYFGLIEPILPRIKGMAHITGGGFFDNIPRILPEGLGARINCNSWTIPPLFEKIQNMGQITNEEMYHVFNMGIGMIIVTSKEEVDYIQNNIPENTWRIGEVAHGKGVTFAK